MDDADLTQERLARELEALLERRRPEPPRAHGYCLWCEAPLPAGRRFCDADCRDDWERDHARRRRPR